MKAAYHKVYGRDLETDIVKDTSGDYQEFFMKLLRGRDETGVYNVDADAEALYKAGPGRWFGLGWGTDESVFIDIINQRPTLHLREVFAAYQAKYGKHIIDLLDSEFSWNIKKGLIHTVQYIIDPIGKIVNDFHKAVAGLGTKDRKLVRLVVRHFRFEAFGAPDRTLFINERYRMEHGEELAPRIARDTALVGEQDYANALQHVLKFGIERRNL